MENEPTLIPCTIADLQKLAAARSALLSRFIPFGLGFVITVFFWRTFGHPLLRVVISALGLLYVLAATVLVTRYLSFRKDFNESSKLVLRGVVKEQGEVDDEPPRYHFFVKTAEREIAVSGPEYAAFRNGDEVEIMLGPNSAHLLGVVKVPQAN